MYGLLIMLQNAHPYKEKKGFAIAKPSWML